MPYIDHPAYLPMLESWADSPLAKVLTRCPSARLVSRKSTSSPPGAPRRFPISCSRKPGRPEYGVWWTRARPAPVWRAWGGWVSVPGRFSG